ncbi:MAG: hypothetical protein ACYC09_10350 [Bacteroidota bacterium]
MNSKISHIELIDFAEGTLDSDRKAEIEEVLRRSPELRQELDEIRTTMDVLQQHEETPPSPQYFQNFVPRLRVRLSGSTGGSRGWIPSWLVPVAAPAVTVFVIGVITLLYTALHPDSGENLLHSIIRQADQSEIDNADTYPLKHYYEDIEYSLIDAETAVEHTLMAGGIFVSQTLNEYEINDERMMTQLNEQDVAVIIAYLNDRSVQ